MRHWQTLKLPPPHKRTNNKKRRVPPTQPRRARQKRGVYMSAKNGKPCIRCGSSDWDKGGECKACNRERNSRWQRENPDKMARKSRRWNQINQKKVAAQSHRWRQANPSNNTAKMHRRRTRKTQAGGSFTAEEWKSLCNHYGNKCLCCGRKGVRLTADHIKPVIKGGTSNIDNIQPLCGSCNSAKHDKHIDYRPDAGPLRWLQAKLFG